MFNSDSLIIAPYSSIARVLRRCRDIIHESVSAGVIDAIDVEDKVTTFATSPVKQDRRSETPACLSVTEAEFGVENECRFFRVFGYLTVLGETYWALDLTYLENFIELRRFKHETSFFLSGCCMAQRVVVRAVALLSAKPK